MSPLLCSAGIDNKNKGGDSKMMDFTNVEDVASSILKATERAIRLNEEKDVRLPGFTQDCLTSHIANYIHLSGDTQEEHYNIVSGNSTSLMKLARLILKVRSYLTAK